MSEVLLVGINDLRIFKTWVSVVDEETLAYINHRGCFLLMAAGSYRSPPKYE